MSKITTIAGDDIDNSSASWTCGGGQLTVTLARNAKLATNGWLPAAEHTIHVTVGNNTHSFFGVFEHPQYGYCITLDMGKITVRVPSDQQNAVRSMLAERAEYNATQMQAATKAESEYEAHRAGVIAMLNK